jgi:hypothetical protein
VSLFAALLAIIAAALIAGALARARRPDSAVPAIVTLIPTVALALLVVCLWGASQSQHRLDGARIVLRGVAVDLRALHDQPISIGGDANRDLLMVSGLPPQAAILSAGQDGQIILAAPEPPAGGPYGLIKVGKVTARTDQTARALCLGPGSEDTLSLRAGRLVSADGDTGPPLRGTGVFPVRAIAPLGRATDPLVRSSASFIVSGQPALPFGPPTLRLAAMDRGARLARTASECASAPPPPDRFNIDASGRATDVNFYRADLEPLGEPSAKTAGAALAGRLSLARTLHLFVHDGKLVISLDTPEVERISGPALHQALDIRNQAGFDNVVLAFSGVSPGVGTKTLASLPFPSLTAYARSRLFGRIELRRGSGGLSAIDSHGPEPVAFGRGFELGGDVAALMEVDRVDLSWSAYRHVAWLPVAALVMSLVGSWRLRRRSTMAFLLLSLLDVLLIVRLIVGAEAAYVTDAPRVLASVGDALFALIAAPFFIASLDPDRGDRGVRLLHGALCMAAIVCLSAAGALAGGGLDGLRPETGSPLGATGGVCFLLCLAGVARLGLLNIDFGDMRSSWSKFGAGTLRAVASVVLFRGIAARATVAAAAFRRWAADSNSVSWPIFLLALTGGIRTVLALLHILREAVSPFHIRMPVSIIYTPLCLALFAWALLRIGRTSQLSPRPRGYRWQTPALWAAWILACAVGPAAAHDSGYVFTNSGPFLLWGALAAMGATSLGFWTRAWLAAPGALLVMVFAGLSLSGSGVSQDGDAIARAAANPTSPGAHRLLDQYSDARKLFGFIDKANLLRLEAVFNPAAMSSQASWSAERDRSVIADRGAYADTMGGRGWLNLDRPNQLEADQLDDNVSIIHIVSPFGRVGGAVFLLLEGIVAAAATLAMFRRSGPDIVALPLQTSLGLLCLWTLFAVSAYMFLGNVQIVPFTGRNVYLLAARSLSDLVEGLLILSLAYWLLRRKETTCLA